MNGGIVGVGVGAACVSPPSGQFVSQLAYRDSACHGERNCPKPSSSTVGRMRRTDASREKSIKNETNADAATRVLAEIARQLGATGLDFRGL